MTDTDEAQFWMRRARSRWKITARLEALSILLLALLASIAANAHSPPGGPAQLGQAWVAVTAIGSLAAGVGTIVGAVAAVVAQRIAAKAEQTPGSHNAAGEIRATPSSCETAHPPAMLTAARRTTAYISVHLC